ncbi:glycosyltransferase family A protein [Halobacillus sp. B29]|uniref:glycosyltransferase family A protein n=1 Tax=Halobacillus sp. B29 TaxID=3457432 RepID=UPI003FCC86B4
MRHFKKIESNNYNLIDYMNGMVNSRNGNKTYEVLEGIIRNYIETKLNNERDIERETLVKVILGFVEGKISNSVLRFYLMSKVMLTETEFIELLNILYEFKGKQTNEIDPITLFEKNYSPTVSVIIPTFNRKDYLVHTVNSLMEQDYPNLEIIIIDDNSTDGTELLVKEIFYKETRITYHKNKDNLGPGINRKIGFKDHSAGEFILFLDDDDYLIDSNYISKSVNFHYNNPNVSFVAANVFYEYTKTNQFKVSPLKLNRITNAQNYFLNFEKPSFPKPVSTLTSLFKRKSLIDMGIDEMNMVNDASIYLRALLVGDGGFLEDIVGVYRVHGNNITYNLSVDFILENLNEKMIIKKLAVDQYGYDDGKMNIWFERIARNTISYYLSNSAEKVSDFTNMYKWSKYNCPSIYKELKRSYRSHIYKKQLKKLPFAIKTFRYLKS